MFVPEQRLAPDRRVMVVEAARDIPDAVVAAGLTGWRWHTARRRGRAFEVVLCR